MPKDQDPYRTLELARGASLDEVKRAYRRLAKVHHPDAAGEAALPRFLAIQAAYEQLVGGSFTLSRTRRGATPRRPSEAGQDRGDATRRAYGGRARSASPGASGTSGATEASGATGPSGAAGASGAAPGADRGNGSSAGSRRRRPTEPRTAPPPSGDASHRPADGRRSKATMGSTSYDGADGGPFEPDWRGASWYGTTSGTYWTLNPKEYADPRKHGPEYQARARRAARGRTPETGSPSAATSGAADPAADEAAAGRARGSAAGPTHTTSSWWDSTAGPTGPTGATGPTGPEPDSPASERMRRRDGPTAGALDPPPPDLGRAAADIARALTDDRFGGMRGRFFRAVLGWLPIALGLGWVVGELTGCGRFAASCDGAVEPFLMLLQVALLGALLLVPTAASVATTAALALLAAAVVAALILSATGGAADGDSRRAALGAVLLVAWLVGLAIAIARRLRALPRRTSPVS